ncbi:MAG: hypothetical protein IKZ74_06475 [Clostridiales bacterium]|nr:hypothetical protein [Clostridiales bacterium]
MKSNEINSGITLTAKEAETITRKLVDAGIDRELVESVIIGHVANGCPRSMNCMHGVCMHACDRYFRVSTPKGCNKTENCVHTHPCNNYFGPPKKSDIEKFKRALVEKGIDLKSIHPKAEKLFRS